MLYIYIDRSHVFFSVGSHPIPLLFSPRAAHSGRLQHRSSVMGMNHGHRITIWLGEYPLVMGFIVIQWNFIVIQWDMNGIYPLVISYIAIENGHRNSGFTKHNHYIHTPQIRFLGCLNGNPSLVWAPCWAAIRRSRPGRDANHPGPKKWNLDASQLVIGL